MPDGEHYGGIVDRHLVFTPDVAEKALGMIEPILRRPSALKAEMDWDRTWNIERYTAFHMDREGLTERFRTFPYVMFTVRGEADSTSWSLGQFDPKVGAFVKYPVEFEAARRFSQLFASEADWRTAARHNPSSSRASPSRSSISARTSRSRLRSTASAAASCRRTGGRC